MPYKLDGKTVLHYKGGRWTKKQTCASPSAAKKAMRLLNAIDHDPDFVPNKDKESGDKKKTSKTYIEQ